VLVAGAGAVALVSGSGLASAATHPRPSPTPSAPAAPVNADCSLIVPADPLSAAGLATPYQLVATDPRQGPCSERDPGQAAFVEASVIDPATGAVSVYHPLVVDQHSRPAAAPVAPKLPQGAVVGIWFGSNGNVLSLRSSQNSLRAGNCVGGLGNSTFGQFGYCNAVAFFQAANAAITAKKLVIPAAQNGRDGMPCPTTRDFGVVDQDQSDNVTSTYLVLGNGRIAQNTTANRTRLGPGALSLSNGSDNGLVDRFIDPALGCTPMTAPDLADPGVKVPSLALNELAAAVWQAAPVALVPPNDPMTLVGTAQSVAKTNLYRAGVDQPAVNAAVDTPTAYCRNLVTIAPARLWRDRRLTIAAPSPDPAASRNLFAFLAQRLQQSFVNLGCRALLHARDPLQLNRDQAGAAIDAVPAPTASPDAVSPNAVSPNAAGPSPAPSVSPAHF
jgi:hypothetical protein